MNRRDFLTWLYEYCEGGQVETRALPKPRTAFHKRGDWASVDKFCKTHSQKNLYYAVATRNGGGTKDHISEIPAVWADIDFKDFPGKEKEAKKIIWEFSLRPSVLLASGGGYQAIWRLKEPAGKNDIPTIEKILKAFCHLLGADKQSAEAAHILRLPETTNHKYDHKPTTKIIWDNRKLEYNPEDFDDLPTPTELLKTIHIEGVRGGFDPPAHSNLRDIAGQNGTLRDILHPVNFAEGHHDETLFSMGWHLAKGGMPESEVLKVLEYTAKKLDPVNETHQWAREKTRSAFTRLSHKERNLSDEIRAFVRDTSGTFTGQEVDKECDIGTKRDKENRKKVLQRLLKENIIERVGGKNSHYRRIEIECDPIDYLSAPTTQFDVTLPLDLNELSCIYPKNIVLIAGDPNSGKTALCLNILRDNMELHEVVYFSSEMGDTEMRTRLENFAGVTLQDWKFQAYERASNFADVIRPDAINIIDYLEISGEFWDISGKLREIHERLGKGIAIIALQKSRGKTFGRGDTFSAEKPRLYLSVSNDYPGHRVEIAKVKGWPDGIENPNGLARKFKLVKGCRLIATTEWEREE